jgi:chaperonin cofactor prefoldin
MSGVSISVTIDDAAVRRAVGRIERAMDDTTPVMRLIGEALVSSTHMRFVTQTEDRKSVV